MSATRQIIYIRAIFRPPLFFRVIGGDFHLAERFFYPDGNAHNGYFIARGDLVEVTIRGRKQRIAINEFGDLCDNPEAVIQYEKLREGAKKRPRR